MKRLLSLLLAALLLTAALLSLASCGSDVKGTYLSENGYYTYEFSRRELTVYNKLEEFGKLYSYKIDELSGNRYLFLTLKEYVYEGENASVAAYVEALNKGLEGTEQKEERIYFAETKEGKIKIGSTLFVKQD